MKSKPNMQKDTQESNASPGDQLTKTVTTSTVGISKPCDERHSDRDPDEEIEADGVTEGKKNVSDLEKSKEDMTVAQKNRRGSRKLDDMAFKPWGGCSVSISRSSSDTGSSGSETYFCKGGPGKETCGDPVLDGELGVRCDGCLAWYHSGCQAISKDALQAIEQWHPVLSWLCPVCKAVPNRKDTGNTVKLQALEAKVDKLANFVTAHMRTIEQCLKEQERASVENGKLVKSSIKEIHQQKVTYADMVKGSCDEVLSKVSAQIASLPTDRSSKITAKATRTCQ